MFKIIFVSSLAVLLSSCFVKQTIQRATTMAKVVTGNAPNVKVYKLPQEYAFTIFATESGKWSRAEEDKNGTVTVNNVINPLMMGTRAVAVVKFNLDSLPQEFKNNPDKIQEAMLYISCFDSYPNGLTNLSTGLIRKPYDKDNISWSSKPKIDQLAFTMGDVGTNNRIRVVNVRPYLVKMLKKKYNYGFLIEGANNTPKGENILKEIVVTEANGCFARIQKSSIQLSVY